MAETVKSGFLRHEARDLSLPPPLGWGHGLVIRRRVLGEADLVIEALFLGRGVMECIVRSGALITAPQKAALSPPCLTFFRFQWLKEEQVRARWYHCVEPFPAARRHPFIALEICYTLSTYLPRGWWEPGPLRVALRALRSLERGTPPGDARLLFRLGFLEVTGHSPINLLPGIPLKGALRSPLSKDRQRLERIVNALWARAFPQGPWHGSLLPP